MRALPVCIMARLFNASFFRSSRGLFAGFDDVFRVRVRLPISIGSRDPTAFRGADVIDNFYRTHVETEL